MIPSIGHRPTRTQTKQNKWKSALAVPGKGFSAAIAIQDWMLPRPAALLALPRRTLVAAVRQCPSTWQSFNIPSFRITEPGDLTVSTRVHRGVDPRHEVEGLSRPQPHRVRRRPRGDSPCPDGRLVPRLHGTRRLGGKSSLQNPYSNYMDNLTYLLARFEHL